MKKYICIFLILIVSVTAFAADYTSYADSIDDIINSYFNAVRKKEYDMMIFS